MHAVLCSLPASEITTGKGIDDAYEQAANLGSDIQALSHRLHSSGLEYLGLRTAVMGFCREVSERQQLKIQLRVENLPETLSHEVSLYLFRVLQEAVHNPGDIQLLVRDSGAGFDPDNVNGHGLGLTSMRERLRLVNGHLSIESRPQHGTTVRASVPVEG